jgi:hypothetical protein
VHGDGQYAPEKLPALLAPLLAGEADAVFGSRMIDKRAARAGGMPLYKWLGNQILTGFSELDAGHAPFRVPLWLPALFHESAGPDPVRKKYLRVPFRHRDHHSIRAQETADRRAANPDLLRQ